MLEDEPGTSAQDTPIWDNRLVGVGIKIRTHSIQLIVSALYFELNG